MQYRLTHSVGIAKRYSIIHRVWYTGRVMTRELGLLTLLELRNALILSIKDPQPGLWIIRMSAHGPYTVRVTGLSSLDFVHGFSLQPTLALNDTVPQPTRGKPVLFVNISALFIHRTLPPKNCHIWRVIVLNHV